MHDGEKMIEELVQQLDVLCRQIIVQEQSKMKGKRHYQKCSQIQEPALKIAR
jgi:hypothetical protein